MTRNRFLTLLNQLKGEAKAIHTKVEFEFSEKDSEHEQGVYGCFYPRTNTIGVIIFGKPKYSKILAVFAHELRHAQHLKLGLYSDYYSLEYYTSEYIKILQSNPWKAKLPNIKVGIWAENDCNRFAIDWLKRHGIDPNVSYLKYLYIPYQDEEIHHYLIYQEVKRQREVYVK